MILFSSEPPPPPIPYTVTASLYWYDPALGGINCDHDCDYLGTGDKVAEWYGRALACPVEFPRGTRFEIVGSRWGLADGVWTCLDAGSAVVIRPDGVVVLDLLLRYPIWQENLTVTVREP